MTPYVVPLKGLVLSSRPPHPVSVQVPREMPQIAHAAESLVGFAAPRVVTKSGFDGSESSIQLLGNTHVASTSHREVEDNPTYEPGKTAVAAYPFVFVEFTASKQDDLAGSEISISLEFMSQNSVFSKSVPDPHKISPITAGLHMSPATVLLIPYVYSGDKYTPAPLVAKSETEYIGDNTRLVVSGFTGVVAVRLTGTRDVKYHDVLQAKGLI